MWDNVTECGDHLSHDRPCLDCGHALHTFLPCSDECACRPAFVPGLVGATG
jgi:hypothetical protein